MKAYLVQLDIQWRDKHANFVCVRKLLAGRVLPGSLVVLPEMFATGFDVEFGGLVEGSPGQLAETGDFLSALARELQCVIQGSGITPAPDGRRQNLVVAYGPEGNVLGKFQKLHPFTYGGEHKRFEAGRDILLYPAGDAQVAPFICYDLRFPEAFRHAVRAGAQIFTVPANWPSPKQAHWLPLLQARAIENQCFVLGVNRAGRDKFLEYKGESAVFGPQGERIALAGPEERVLEADLDLENLKRWRKTFPALGDIHSELLGHGVSFFKPNGSS
ncbi:MAG TPA: nitrilase-related carbon-nitrogen hydrolase [Fibrobacteraceae bacterium]|nr:nitrilase-related carbon-nitrogen hydrolase [Fibrobacteraceae bacterium]